MNTEKNIVKEILADRPMLALIAGMIAVAVIYMIIVLFSVSPSDVTVYNRFTSFGEAHFYKGIWQYQFLFVAFGAFVAAIHIALMAKLIHLDKRSTAVFVGVLGMSMLIITLLLVIQIMSFGKVS